MNDQIILGIMLEELNIVQNEITLKDEYSIEVNNGSIILYYKDILIRQWNKERPSYIDTFFEDNEYMHDVSYVTILEQDTLFQYLKDANLKT